MFISLNAETEGSLNKRTSKSRRQWERVEGQIISEQEREQKMIKEQR